MKAVYFRDFGGPEVLEIREVPDPPSPVGSEVLVRVKAAGLNRADLLQRKGVYPAPNGFDQRIPGLEFAGEIEAAGPDAAGFSMGDRVFGITAGEAQAEKLLISSSLLAKVPTNLDHIEAAAIPEAFITAHDAIATQAGLRVGETLLIHAAASGVGLAALQIAKAQGALVIGTSRSAEKLDRCREFGLDLGIDLGGKPEFAKKVAEFTNGVGANVILDLIGASYFAENLNASAKRGRLMLVGLVGGAIAEADLRVVLYKRMKIIGTVLRPRSEAEKAAAVASFAWEILPMIAAGRLKPNIDRIFDAGQVREAHEYLESNQSFGKVILTF